MDDRDRAAPVALPGEQPVAQAEVDRAVAAALAVEPFDDRGQGLAVAHPVEARVGVHQRAVPHVGELLLGVDDAPDRQAELLGEGEVALVVARDGHDRAGPVLHQHVVGDPHRDLLAVDGIGDRAAQRHAGLLPLGRPAVGVVLGQRAVDVVARLLLVLRAGGEPHDVRMLGRHHEEGRAEERVRAGGEDRVVRAERVAVEGDLRALGAPDPVALHRDDVVGPLDRLRVVEQPLRVLRDAEEPLLELTDLDDGAAALAAAVDDLLVGEHGRVLRAPVDGGLAPVGEALLQHPQEDPLRPAVVARLVGAELARPVDADAPRAELLLELLDRLRRAVARVLARLDRVVLGRQAEGVVAHRVQDAAAVAAMEVGDRVADGVVLQVPHVGLAARVRQHLEHVVLRAVHGVVVADVPRLLALPDLLPLGLDPMRLVPVLCHGRRSH